MDLWKLCSFTSASPHFMGCKKAVWETQLTDTLIRKKDWNVTGIKIVQDQQKIKNCDFLTFFAESSFPIENCALLKKNDCGKKKLKT